MQSTHAKPLTKEEIEAYRGRVMGTTPFPGGPTPKGLEAAKAALDGWHARNLATIDMLTEDNKSLTERMEAALSECQCPDCKCRDQIDAESSECGCDSPICSRPGGQTLAQWALAMHAKLAEIRETSENLLAASKLPLSPALHAEGLMGGVEKIKRLAENGA
jgi:hypothetical protein